MEGSPTLTDGNLRKETVMEPKDYVVTKIEGEYAYLREINGGSDAELFIALALLPSGTDEGSRLHYEMLTYTLL